MIRELWLLREQARVQAAERAFLVELQAVLGRAMTAGGFGTVEGEGEWDDDAWVRERVEEGDGRVGGEGRVREVLGGDREGVMEVARQGVVTGMRREFREMLDNGAMADQMTEGVMVRARSFGELNGQRAVSGVLSGAFRHELEGVLGRRGEGERVRERTVAEEVGDTSLESGVSPGGGGMESAVRALREEVSVLKNVIGASFDMQLDIQRAIRQEVSAAMSQPKPEAQGSAEPVDYAGKRRYEPAQSGTCIVCLEASVDAVLYGCGHMCSCALCGRHLIAAGQGCPVCRAPIKDVVRVFMCAQDG